MDSTKTTIAKINIQSIMLYVDLVRQMAKQKNNEAGRLLLEDSEAQLINANQVLEVFEELIAENNYLGKRCFDVEDNLLRMEQRVKELEMEIKTSEL